MASTNEQMIGRDDINDLEAILSVTNTDVDEVAHAVQAEADAIFTWDYEQSRPAAASSSTRRPRRRSGTPTTDLDWSTDVDQEAVVHREPGATERLRATTIDLTGTPFEKWGDKEWIEFGIESQNWTPVAVHARRAGRADLHRADRRDRAVDRRQVLRGDAGDGRGPPRRGVRQVPRRRSSRVTTRSTRTSRCCSTTSSPTPAGT